MPPCPHHRGRHGWRGASSGAPAAVLRVGIGSRGGVDHAGAVRLAGTSPPACFGRPEPIAPPCVLCCVADMRGPVVSEREGERTERFVIF